MSLKRLNAYKIPTLIQTLRRSIGGAPNAGGWLQYHEHRRRIMADIVSIYYSPGVADFISDLIVVIVIH